MKPSMRRCPTCSTPAYAQTAPCYHTPNEAILRGIVVLEHGLPGLIRNDVQASYELVEAIFRAVLGQDGTIEEL